jgi:hypothetical protein
MPLEAIKHIQPSQQAVARSLANIGKRTGTTNAL